MTLGASKLHLFSSTRFVSHLLLLCCIVGRVFPDSTLFSQAFKALDNARLVLESAAQQEAELDGRRDQVSITWLARDGPMEYLGLVMKTSPNVRLLCAFIHMATLFHVRCFLSLAYREAKLDSTPKMSTPKRKGKRKGRRKKR